MLVNQPHGYSEMGVFSAANQWYALILLLPAVLGQVLFPMGAERLSRDDGRGAARLMLMSMKLNGVIVLPVVIIGSLASPLVMRAYGRGFESGWPTLVVVFVTAGLLAIQGPAGQMINASGKVWIGFWMNLGWGLAFLGITPALVFLGGLGLALARLGAYLLHATWTLWYARCVIRATKGAVPNA
jgi:O-antigen/teichoic acid export membrane protein